MRPGVDVVWMKPCMSAVLKKHVQKPGSPHRPTNACSGWPTPEPTAKRSVTHAKTRPTECHKTDKLDIKARLEKRTFRLLLWRRQTLEVFEPENFRSTGFLDDNGSHVVLHTYSGVTLAHQRNNEPCLVRRWPRQYGLTRLRKRLCAYRFPFAP